jgi:hypothetical protein
MSAPVAPERVVGPAVGEHRPRPLPTLVTRTLSIADLASAGPSGYRVDLPGAVCIALENRTARPILARLGTALQDEGMSLILDDGQTIDLDLSFPASRLVLLDLYASSGVNVYNIVAGMREGVRDDMALPFAAGPTSPGGRILISAASQRMAIRRSERVPRPKVNWSQEAVSAGAGTATLAASAALATAGVLACGYFQLLVLQNTGAGNFTAAVAAAGSNGTITSTITVLPGASLTLPMECESVTATFTAAGQSVKAYQSVVINVDNEP